MKKSKFVLWLVFLCAAATAGSALARDRHHHHHRSHLGIYVGVPLAFSYAYPWYAPPPYYYYPPPVVVRPEPQVYIERAAPQTAPPPAPQTQNYWYYCTNPQGYYPYVKDCPGGWLHVVPTPPN